MQSLEALALRSLVTKAHTTLAEIKKATPAHLFERARAVHVFNHVLAYFRECKMDWAPSTRCVHLSRAAGDISNWKVSRHRQVGRERDSVDFMLTSHDGSDFVICLEHIDGLVCADVSILAPGAVASGFLLARGDKPAWSASQLQNLYDAGHELTHAAWSADLFARSS
jgi:hypothetical protein